MKADRGGDAGNAVRVERRGAVLVMTINRPNVRNAADAAVASGLREAVDLLESTPELKVGILTGAGRYFCSGADLAARSRGEVVVDGDGLCGLTRRRRTKPLIAAVEGGAAGGGFELVLACDLVVAAEGAQFALPEVKRVVMAAEGGLVRVVARVGCTIAMELALTGDPMPADRAWSLGLVNHLASPGEALNVAFDLAERIATNSAAAVTETLEVVTELASHGEDEGWQMVGEAYRRVRSSPDHPEAVTAFLERREPRWS